MNESIHKLIIGVWAPVEGNPQETVAYREDGIVRMAVFGGLLHMDGRYSFVAPDVIEINWQASPSAEAKDVIGAVNEKLDHETVPTSVRIVRQSVMRVQVTGDELQTLHLEKGRVGRYHRVHTGTEEDEKANRPNR